MQAIKVSLWLQLLLKISLHNWPVCSTSIIAAHRMTSCNFKQSSSPDIICTTPGEDYPWMAIQKYMENHHGDLRRIFAASPLDSPFIHQTEGLFDQAIDTSNLNASAKLRLGIKKAKNACAADMALEQPYWMNNDQGHLRVILNNSPFQQFIQVERCLESGTSERNKSACLSKDCRCVQEYRMIRLVAFNPSLQEESHGIFMDWFKIPSCCQCKCLTRPDRQKFSSTSSTPSPLEIEL